MEKFAHLSRKDVQQDMKGSYNRFRNILYYNANAINLLDFIHFIVNTIDDEKKLAQLLHQGYDSIKLAEEIVDHGSLELNKIYVDFHRQQRKSNDRLKHSVFLRYQFKVAVKGDFEKFKLFCCQENVIFPEVEADIIRRRCRPLMNSDFWLETMFREHELSAPAMEVFCLTDCDWAWKKYQEFHKIPKYYRRRHFWRGFLKLFSP